MRARTFVFALVSLSFALLVGFVRLHAQEATPQATDLVAELDLSQHYAGSQYSLDIPADWVTQADPGAVALASSQGVVDETFKLGIPPLTAGEIEIEIMSGVIDSKLKPGVDFSRIVNVNCTTCHVLYPSPAPVNVAETLPSLRGVAASIAQIYSHPPQLFTFADAQATTVGDTDAVEATFTAKAVDGLLIAFYAKGQLVNFIALVAPGEVEKQRPLLEAIASTIQVADNVPAATVEPPNATVEAPNATVEAPAATDSP